MSLKPIDYLNGTFSLLVVIVGIIIGLIIISKYFTYRKKELALVGVFWMGIYSPWWPSSISFLLVLFTGRGLETALYFMIGNVLAPWFLLIWIIAFSDMVCKDKQKIIVSIFIISGALFNTYLLYYIFTDPSVIGELEGYFDVTYKSVVMIYLVHVLIVMLVTGILFTRQSLKSSSPELRLRGKILLIAFLCYVFGGLFDAAIPLTAITLVITRLTLIVGSILFYFGFMLPNIIKKRFSKENDL